MPGPLVQRRWHRSTWVVATAGLVLGIALGAITFRRASTSFDTWVSRELYWHIGDGAKLLLKLSDPYLTAGLITGVALCAALARRWDLAVFAAIGPTAAILIVEYILKPIFGRQIGPYALFGSVRDAVRGSYPSGHETGVVSAALVILVLAGQLPLARRWRAVVFVVLALWVVFAAVGLVRNFYHYATDTIGALGFTLAIVLGTALLIDRYLPVVRERVAARRVS